MTWRRLKYLVARAIIKPFGNWQLFPYPFFLLLGDTHYKVKGRETRVVADMLRTGDILLRRYRNYISGWFIPGYYTHVALYVGDNHVIHAIGKGVVKEDILTFLRTDEVAVLRVRADEKRVKTACDEAHNVLGAEYDFIFDSIDDKRFYCSELVKHCYEGLFDQPEESGVIKPDVFIESDNADMIFESRVWRERKKED